MRLNEENFRTVEYNLVPKIAKPSKTRIQIFIFFKEFSLKKKDK